LFADETFADLFSDIGRESTPPRIVAIVMVLQRAEGLGDRDAAERLRFDLRWKYACGGLDVDYAGFDFTRLCRMRSRLRKSERPNRIFEAALEVCKAAGLVGRKRAMDSTALYDAVATQDTVTLIRSAIRQLLRAADEELELELRAGLGRDDDYRSPGKPSCDWQDEQERETLIDALASDAYAALACLDSRTLTDEVSEAAQLLATVVGQDLEQRDDGVFRIARRVAPDRVISTVDPEARHGHKTSSRSFDGYKGHISVDPDSEIITASDVTPGNLGDGEAADELLREMEAANAERTPKDEPMQAYGDASYGTAEIVERLEQAGIEPNVKVQEPARPHGGLFSKSAFKIDLEGQQVRCPQGFVAPIRPCRDGTGRASFGEHCPSCPLRPRCTNSNSGRSIRIHARERTLQRSRKRQRSSAWKADYQATRPKVERKFGHLMRHRHGGRRARVRGVARVTQDFAMLCAVANLKRLAVLGVHHDGTNWSP
jgi:transposase